MKSQWAESSLYDAVLVGGAYIVVNGGRSSGGRSQACQYVNQRRFTGAVVTQQTRDLAFVDVQ